MLTEKLSDVMADLTLIEKRKLERLFRMDSGYVLNFSDRIFEGFVLDSTGLDIYDAKYNYRSGSKANRLRAFWNEESNHVVSKLLSDLIEYGDSEELFTRLIHDGPWNGMADVA